MCCERSRKPQTACREFGSWIRGFLTYERIQKKRPEKNIEQGPKRPARAARRGHGADVDAVRGPAAHAARLALVPVVIGQEPAAAAVVCGGGVGYPHRLVVVMVTHTGWSSVSVVVLRVRRAAARETIGRAVCHCGRLHGQLAQGSRRVRYAPPPYRGVDKEACWTSRSGSARRVGVIETPTGTETGYQAHFCHSADCVT